MPRQHSTSYSRRIGTQKEEGLAKGKASYTLVDDHGLATGVRESKALLGCRGDVVVERVVAEA